MKKTFKILTIALVFLLSPQAYSQISIGGQAAYSSVTKTFGVGIRGDYAVGERTVYSAGFNYFLTDSYTQDAYAQAYSSTTEPNTISVPVEYKASLMSFYIDGKRYFVGDYEDTFNVYALGEVGYFLLPVTVEAGDYDSDKYGLTVDTESQSYGNLNFGFGIGAEKDFNFGYLYTEAKLIFPANTVNGNEVSYDIPTSFAFNVGIRIPFGY